MPLRPDDRLGVDGRTYIFKSYIEKTTANYLDDSVGAGKKGPASAWPSLLLGFGREITAAALFGAGKIMDVFSVARTVTGFLSRLLGSGAMKKAFMPIFSRLFRRGPRKKAWEATAPLVTATLLFSLLLSAAGMLLAPAIIDLLFPGLAAHGMSSMAAHMTRILFPGLVPGLAGSHTGRLSAAFQKIGQHGVRGPAVCRGHHSRHFPFPTRQRGFFTGLCRPFRLPAANPFPAAVSAEDRQPPCAGVLLPASPSRSTAAPDANTPPWSPPSAWAES